MKRKFQVGDAVRLRSLKGAGPEHTLVIGYIYTVDHVSENGEYIRVDGGNGGMWDSWRFEPVDDMIPGSFIELDFSQIEARVIADLLGAYKGEFYVAESRKNGQGSETFCRAGDLYSAKFDTYDKAEAFAVDRAQNNPHQKFAIMQIHARIESKPLYQTTVTRA